MSFGAAAESPAKLAIANMATAESIEAQFNPREFSLSLAVNYEQVGVQGSSYLPLQFKNTGNMGVPLELFYRVVTPEEMQKKLDDEAFLLSLCYQREIPGSITAAAPPRVLIAWSYIALQCVVRNLGIKFTRFNIEGEPVEATFTLQLEEVSDGQRYSADVRRRGLTRASTNVLGGRGAG